MVLTEPQKKRRKNIKELKSLRNKMSDKNIVWFDALTLEQQFDVLFLWKKEKYTKKLLNITQPVKKKSIKKVRVFERGRWVYKTQVSDVIKYPPNLKHFIESIKPNFAINKTRLRDSQLKHLLD